MSNIYNKWAKKKLRGHPQASISILFEMQEQEFQLQPVLPGSYASSDIFLGYSSFGGSFTDDWQGGNNLNGWKETNVGKACFPYINAVKNTATGQYEYKVKLSRKDGQPFSLMFLLRCGPYCTPTYAQGVTKENKTIDFIIHERECFIVRPDLSTTELIITMSNNTFFGNDKEFAPIQDAFLSLISCESKFTAYFPHETIEKFAYKESLDVFLNSLHDITINVSFFASQIWGDASTKKLLDAIQWVHCTIEQDPDDINIDGITYYFLRCTNVVAHGMGDVRGLDLTLRGAWNDEKFIIYPKVQAGKYMRVSDIMEDSFTLNFTTDDAKLIGTSTSPYKTLPLRDDPTMSYRVEETIKDILLSQIVDNPYVQGNVFAINIALSTGTICMMNTYTKVLDIKKWNPKYANVSDPRHITDNEMINDYPIASTVSTPNPLILIFRNTGGKSAYQNLVSSTQEITLYANEWIKIDKPNVRIYLPESITKNPACSIIDYPSYFWVKSPTTQKISIIELPRENPEPYAWRTSIWAKYENCPPNTVEKDLTNYQTYWGIRAINDIYAETWTTGYYTTLTRLTAYWNDVLSYSVKYTVKFRGDVHIKLGEKILIDTELRKNIPAVVVSNSLNVDPSTCSGELEVLVKE